MLISWIQKTTLLDFPWKVACIIFTASCNLRCSYCHNKEFVLPKEIQKIKDFIPKEVFFNFLKTKIWLLDWVVICGGEPTMQQDLEDFCVEVKKMWFLIKLDTNWYNPLILERLIKNKLVDYVAMDIKWDYENLENLLWVKYNKLDYFKSIDILKKGEVDYEFRTTLIKKYHLLENFDKVVKQISWSKRYFLQNYRGWYTLKDDFDWESFTSKELLDFQKIALKYINEVKIRL